MKNRLVSTWNDQSELIGNIVAAIDQAKEKIERHGWHRGEGEEKIKLLEENKRLKEEILLLRENQAASNDNTFKSLGQSFFGKKITLHYTETVIIASIYDNHVPEQREIKTTLDELFKFISLRLTGKPSLRDFIKAVSNYQDGFYVDQQDALIVRNKYEQLGLIQSTLDKDNNEMVELTELGRKVMNYLNS